MTMQTPATRRTTLANRASAGKRLLALATPVVLSLLNGTPLVMTGWAEGAGTGVVSNRRATILRTVQTSLQDGAVEIVLGGNGKLEPSTVTETEDLPHRLVLDFDRVISAAPSMTVVGQGSVLRVRVAQNSRTPLKTRVVVDLDTPAPYRVETTGYNGYDVRVVVGSSLEQPQMATPVATTAFSELGEALPLLESGALASVSALQVVDLDLLDLAKEEPTSEVPQVPEQPASVETTGYNAFDVRAIVGSSLELPQLATPVATTTFSELGRAPHLLDSEHLGSVSAPQVVDPGLLALAKEEPTSQGSQMPGQPAPPPVQVQAQAGPIPAPVVAPAAALPPVTQLEAQSPVESIPEAPVPTPSIAAAAQTPAEVASTVDRPPTGTLGLAALVNNRSQLSAAAGQTPMRTYSGHPISLDFQNADLRAVLRTFSEISGLNLVIDPAVNGSVDVTLRDVPWDQALDLILRANKLGYVVDGTVVRIAPLAVLADEESQRRKLAEEQALAGELNVITRPLSYARAEDIKLLLTRSALTQRGEVEVDVRTNTLILRDLPVALATASDLITTLDKPQPQVEIEARIVQTNRDFARSIGVQWGFSGRAAPDLGNTLPFAFPNQAGVTGRIGTQSPPNQPADSAGTAVNLGVQAATSAIGVSLGSINGAINLDVALSALERSGKGRLLSTPRVSTQNNVEAEVTQGVQIPIQTVANNTVTVSFRDAALTLKVTPQITAAGTVIMKISLENSTPDFTRAVNGIPPINTQRANTQVLVNDAQTTVIGGIYISSETLQNDRTPGLYKVPLLGWLFKRDSVTDESRELLIFITPRIIKG